MHVTCEGRVASDAVADASTWPVSLGSGFGVELWVQRICMATSHLDGPVFAASHDIICQLRVRYGKHPPHMHSPHATDRLAAFPHLIASY